MSASYTLDALPDGNADAPRRERQRGRNREAAWVTRHRACRTLAHAPLANGERRGVLCDCSTTGGDYRGGVMFALRLEEEEPPVGGERVWGGFRSEASAREAARRLGVVLTVAETWETQEAGGDGRAAEGADGEAARA